MPERAKLHQGEAGMRRLQPALGALALGALALGGASGKAGAAGPDELVCAYPFWVGFAPLHLANELGYFEDEGITVEEIIDDDYSNGVAAMERGDIDCYLRSVGEYQGRPRTAESQGTIIGTIDVSDGGDGVVAAGDIRSICDLEGKVFASEPNLPSTLLAQMALKEECNLSIEDVEWKRIASADAVAVMADESVAAVGAYEPVLTQTVEANEARGAHVLLSSRDFPGLITDAIIARTENLHDQPEKYVKLLRGIYRAIDFFNADPDEAIPIMAARFDLTPDEFKEVLQNIYYTDLAASLELMGTDGEPGRLHGLFGEIMQLNLENGAADVELKAAQHIDNSIITEVAESSKK
jgi:NitT/TauT family transport system substrate-binding protein